MTDENKEDKQEKPIKAASTDRNGEETERTHPLLRELDYALELEPEETGQRLERYKKGIKQKAKELVKEREERAEGKNKGGRSPARA